MWDSCPYDTTPKRVFVKVSGDLRFVTLIVVLIGARCGAIPIVPRLALQLVAFSDLAFFETLAVTGQPVKSMGAANIGGGFRLIPTALSNTLLRVDIARLLAPTGTTFVPIWDYSVLLRR